MPGDLSSKWDGLSEHLIASFWEVDRNGEKLSGDDTVIKAPVTDGNFESVMNWVSPFENTGAEAKYPTLFQMGQSGELQFAPDLLPDLVGARERSAAFLAQVEGRTGITKLNSTQIFTGMAPIKIPITLLFRAWSDTESEVEIPVNTLIEWSLPKKLGDDGTLLSRLANQGLSVETVLPSESPTMIAMLYKNRVYSPLVIESIGHSMVAPIDTNGNHVELSVEMTLATLTAIERDDWNKNNVSLAV